MARREEGEYPSWIFDRRATPPAGKRTSGVVQVILRRPLSKPQVINPFKAPDILRHQGQIVKSRGGRNEDIRIGNDLSILGEPVVNQRRMICHAAVNFHDVA